MARTTPAQKPRGEHSNTRSGGLPIESVAVGGIMGIASLGCPNSPYAKWAASAGPVKLRQRHVRDIGQRGLNCIYSGHFSVIFDDSGFAPTGGRSTEEI